MFMTVSLDGQPDNARAHSITRRNDAGGWGTRMIAVIALVIVSSLSGLARAGWVATSLHPSGATSSQAFSIWGNKQAGVVDGNAVIWTNGVANATTNLGSGIAYGIDAAEQVGMRGGLGAMWSGTAGSYQNMDPQPAYPNETGSVVTGVFAGIQSGYVLTTDPPGISVRAVMWSDLPSGWTDLNPTGAFESMANGIYNAQVGGSAWLQNQSAYHAGVWYGNNNFVDLNPNGSDQSEGLDVWNGKQVGYVMLTGQGYRRASLWSNLANTWTDLHPLGASASTAYGVYDQYQVGDAQVGSNTHASFWNGTPGSWVDLHNFLPAGYTDSSASDIWVDNSGVRYVTGWATNGSGQNEAMLWTWTVPEPGSLGLIGMMLLCTVRRRRVQD